VEISTPDEYLKKNMFPGILGLLNTEWRTDIKYMKRGLSGEQGFLGKTSPTKEKKERPFTQNH